LEETPAPRELLHCDETPTLETLLPCPQIRKTLSWCLAKEEEEEEEEGVQEEEEVFITSGNWRGKENLPCTSQAAAVVRGKG